MKFYCAPIVLIICLIESIKSDIYKDCGSQTGSIVSLSVTDCLTLPCKFQRGQNYTMDLKFKSSMHI